jgi:hypothetical protein
LICPHHPLIFSNISSSSSMEEIYSKRAISFQANFVDVTFKFWPAKTSLQHSTCDANHV